MSYPPEIEYLHQALAALPGVTDVCSGIDSLDQLRVEDLGFPDFAHLPHGSLRRTGGGLDGEALMQFEFKIAHTVAAWRSLEFIAWFVRDQARGGVAMQLRPFALPPQIGETVQLGQTLRWHLDLFCANVSEDLTPQFAQVQDIAKGLELAMKIYGDLIERNV